MKNPHEQHPISDWEEAAKLRYQRDKRENQVLIYIIGMCATWLMLIVWIFVITPNKEKAAHNKGELKGLKSCQGVVMDTITIYRMENAELITDTITVIK